MKYVITIILIPFILSATCDFSTIKAVDDDTYIYTKECNRKVGELVRDEGNLDKVVTLQDLVIDKYDERLELWTKKTFELEQELAKKEENNQYTKVICFVGGALLMATATYLAGQLK